MGERVSLFTEMERAMGSFRRWLIGAAPKRVDDLYDRADAESEAVSQEAKALRRDIARACHSSDVFDEMIRDMRRAHAARCDHP